MHGMNSAQECSRIAGLVEALARESLAGSADSSMAWLQALGHRLLGEATGTTMNWSAWRELGSNPYLPMRDELGHHRPVYRLLLLHGGLRVMMTSPSLAEPRPLILPPAHENPSADLQLWGCLLQLEQSAIKALPTAATDAALAQIDELLTRPGEGGSLHRMNADESLDGWTWRELVGLHALAHVCVLAPSPMRLNRLQEVASYHLDNTQPDNTTNQPWGLPGFVLGGAVTLAEQQLHDVLAHATTLASRRPPLLTGLLLADAARLLQRSPKDGSEHTVLKSTDPRS